MRPRGYQRLARRLVWELRAATHRNNCQCKETGDHHALPFRRVRDLIMEEDQLKEDNEHVGSYFCDRNAPKNNNEKIRKQKKKKKRKKEKKDK